MNGSGRKPDDIAARHKILSTRVDPYVHEAATRQAESSGIDRSSWFRAAVEEKLDRDAPGWASMDGTLKLASRDSDRLYEKARDRDAAFRELKKEGLESPEDS